MKEKTLLLTVGLPMSGKSIWAKEQRYPIVNPDSIRLALHGQRYQSLAEPFVWAIAKLMVRSLFFAGHNFVIVDATNISKNRRSFWKSSYWVLKTFTLDTSKEECIRRAKAINDNDIIPIIERMANNYEPVIENEFLIGENYEN